MVPLNAVAGDMLLILSSDTPFPAEIDITIFLVVFVPPI